MRSFSHNLTHTELSVKVTATWSQNRAKSFIHAVFLIKSKYTVYYCVLIRITLLENEENLLKKYLGQKKTLRVS